MEDLPSGKTAIIFIGIPASGKSSFYAQYFQDTYTLINLDTLHTRNKENTLMAECLADGKSFVVDNTNPKKTDRKRYITPAKKEGYRIVGYFFQSRMADCISRNEKRTGKKRVPDIAIVSKSNELELPDKDEGFDSLYFVRMNGNDFVIEEWRDDL